MANAQQSMKVNANKLPSVRCPNCQAMTWGPIYALKFLNRFQSPNGQEQLLNGQIGWRCLGCGDPLNIQQAEMIYPDAPKKEEPPE